MWWEPVSFCAPFRRWKAPRSCFFLLLEADARKLTPIADSSRTIGNETLVWRAALGLDLDSRGRLSLRETGEGARPSTLCCFRFATALAEALDQEVKHGDKE